MNPWSWKASFLAVQDSSISDIVGRSVGLSQLTTLPQNGVNPIGLALWVFQHFWSFVTKIRNPMLSNKFYRGAIFVNWLHFCCSINYQSHSLVHQRIIAVPRNIIFLTKCDQEKHFCKPWFAWWASLLGLLTSTLLHDHLSSSVEEYLRNGFWLYLVTFWTKCDQDKKFLFA